MMADLTEDEWITSTAILYGLIHEKYGITRDETNAYLDSLGL
jgi:hypothetical protein